MNASMKEPRPTLAALIANAIGAVLALVPASAGVLSGGECVRGARSADRRDYPHRGRKGGRR